MIDILAEHQPMVENRTYYDPYINAENQPDQNSYRYPTQQQNTEPYDRYARDNYTNVDDIHYSADDRVGENFFTYDIV